MNTTLKEAYDPEAFRKLGHQLIDMLADHLSEMEAITADGLESNEAMNGSIFRSVITPATPEEEFAFWQKDFAEQTESNGQNTPLTLFRLMLDRSIQIHHPQYLGHQISRPAPLAALAGLVTDLLNNGMGIYEMGKAGTALERLIIELTASVLGYTSAAGGFLTSGGTLANLTALLAARHAKSIGNIWQNGQQQQLALMVSEDAHYCIERAVRIMGWGSKGIIKIPVDKDHQMRIDLLEDIYQQAVADGLEVIALVGCACTTSTGTFDPLTALHSFSKAHGLWFHVDAAHGGGAAFSEKYKALLKDIEMADSVVIDFHKMLLTPVLATAVIFREAQDGYASFALEAEYLFKESRKPEWYNLARRTFECTKQMMSLKIYSLLRTFGTGLFDASVTHLFDQSQRFGQQIKQQAKLELALEPQANILCFRYVDEKLSADQMNELNAQIRAAIVAEGRFYILQTQLKGLIFLRIVVMNPATDEAMFANLLHLVKAKAVALLP